MIPSIALALAAHAVVVQTAAVAAPAAPADDDILVTAQRHADRARDVPFSLKVIDSDALARLHTPTLRDLSVFTPGLYVEADTPSRVYLAIRGIATNVLDVTSEPRIAVFEDGVPISRPQGALGELYDVAQVEVARGPQSTLYGRSALGGAITIATRPADPGRFGYSARAEFGTIGDRRFDAMLNVPLGDGIAVRASGRVRRAGGYLANLGPGDALGAVATEAGRVSLTIAPTSRASLDIIASYQRDRTSGVAGKSGVFAPYDPVSGAVLGDLSPYSGVVLPTASGLRPGGGRTLLGLTALARFELGSGLTVLSTTGYRGTRAHDLEDETEFALPIVSSDEATTSDQLSQELRLTYTSSAVKLLFGANALTETLKRPVSLQYDERLSAFLFLGGFDRTNPVLRPQSYYTNPANIAPLLQRTIAAVGGTLSAAQALAIASNFKSAHRESYVTGNRVNAFDAFADAEIAVTPRLTLLAGARIAVDDKRTDFSSVTQDRFVLAAFLGALRLPQAQRTALLSALAVPGAGTLPQSASYPIPVVGLSAQTSNGTEARGISNVGASWRLAARYAAFGNGQVYANYTRGRRPSTLSANAPGAPYGAVQFTQSAAESVDSVELGAKMRLLDGLLSVEGALYGYRYRNFQTQIISNLTLISVNAGRADALGAELEVRLRPARSLSLVASYAYTHARFRSGVYDGNRLRLSPDHVASLTAVASRPIAGGTIEIAPSVAYRSRYFFDDTNGVPALLALSQFPPLDYRPSQAGFAIGNARLRYASMHGGWSLEAFVENIADKRYLRGVNPGSVDIGLPAYNVAPPRTVGFAIAVGG